MEGCPGVGGLPWGEFQISETGMARTGSPPASSREGEPEGFGPGWD